MGQIISIGAVIGNIAKIMTNHCSIYIVHCSVVSLITMTKITVCHINVAIRGMNGVNGLKIP